MRATCDERRIARRESGNRRDLEAAIRPLPAPCRSVGRRDRDLSTASVNRRRRRNRDLSTTSVNHRKRPKWQPRGRASRRSYKSLVAVTADFAIMARSK